MMTKYVDADALEQMAFGKEHPEFYDGQDIADWYEDCIVNAPAADAAHVVRGEWKNVYKSGHKPNPEDEDCYLLYKAAHSNVCSECDCWSHRRSNFCPNCGCDMRGERDGEK